MRRFGPLLLLLLLAACASRQAPTVVERSLTGSGPATHTVSKGETLYSIALRYDADYRELARLNGLDANFTIHPGQKLKLRPAVASTKGVAPPKVGGTPVQPLDKPLTKPSSSTSDKTFVVKKPDPVKEPPGPATAPPRASTSLAWGWPAKGNVIGTYGSSGVTGKGLDISGRRGDSVLAAAAGTIVYAGSGLVGYGKLLIVRHDDNYISAYAHNDRFLVKEGERVKLGQAIAEMGASGTDREKLHFEIRERGKPVDPMRFLPGR
ncbi:MAG TPA: peptidoglycan DD-metalloendopeptidase family protein [Moraxellaceae bacterium]